MRKFLIIGLLFGAFAFTACKGGAGDGGEMPAPAASVEASPAAGGGGEMAASPAASAAEGESSPAAEASPAESPAAP
ncbi:MAG TPA: hypothetical protein VMV15_00305 [Candidatus Binataceae bacterium]|nr:hypothetical protein [Candidatus Binataceae bacterium]